MTCKYKVKIKDIQYNYKVQMTDIQSKYKFKVFCTGYDDSEIKDKIDAMYQAFPKVSGEGETITLNDTVNTTMAIDLKGNTSQETTTGIQLFDINDTANGYFTGNTGAINSGSIGFYTQKKTATIKTWPSLSLSTEENYFFFVKIAKCLLNFSTRPSVSTIFCLPVKKG